MTIRNPFWDISTNPQRSGNQLAVVPDAGGLDGVTMQRIANEFSLPEPIVVIAPSAPWCHARLCVITPALERPIAGHPTTGATMALARSL